MDDKKKLAALVGVIVIAVAVVGFMMSRGAGGEAPEHSVGTLEEGVNHESGLPLNPPPLNQGGGQGGAQQNDPSLPNGH